MVEISPVPIDVKFWAKPQNLVINLCYQQYCVQFYWNYSPFLILPRFKVTCEQEFVVSTDLVNRSIHFKYRYVIFAVYLISWGMEPSAFVLSRKKTPHQDRSSGYLNQSEFWLKAVARHWLHPLLFQVRFPEVLGCKNMLLLMPSNNRLTTADKTWKQLLKEIMMQWHGSLKWNWTISTMIKTENRVNNSENTGMTRTTPERSQLVNYF